jgi:hypothetical protein
MRRNESGFEQEYVDESEVPYYKKYKRMTGKQLYDRFTESHEDNPKLSKLLKKVRKYIVEPHQKLSEEKMDELDRIIKSAKDERRLQKFLKENPYVLTEKMQPAHHGQICIPKPNLGGFLHPDFLMAGMDSAGFWWYGVELENPNYPMFTKAGNPTRELNTALSQIEDWRHWLRENIAYARDTLGFMHIDGELPCYVLIGRRDEEIVDEEELLMKQRSMMKRDKYLLFLHHYEWLLDDRMTLVRIR